MEIRNLQVGIGTGPEQEKRSLLLILDQGLPKRHSQFACDPRVIPVPPCPPIGRLVLCLPRQVAGEDVLPSVVNAVLPEPLHESQVVRVEDGVGQDPLRIGAPREEEFEKILRPGPDDEIEEALRLRVGEKPVAEEKPSKVVLPGLDRDPKRAIETVRSSPGTVVDRLERPA